MGILLQYSVASRSRTAGKGKLGIGRDMVDRAVKSCDSSGVGVPDPDNGITLFLEQKLGTLKQSNGDQLKAKSN